MLAASQHTCIPPTNPFQLRSALHGLQMERCTHAAILQTLALPLSAWPHFHAVARLFGVSFDTVFSIYSLEVQTRVLRTNHVVKAGMAQHAQAWLAGGCKAMQWGTLWVLPNRPSVRGCLPPPAASRQLADPPPPPHPTPILLHARILLLARRGRSAAGFPTGLPALRAHAAPAGAPAAGVRLRFCASAQACGPRCSGAAGCWIRALVHVCWLQRLGQHQPAGALPRHINAAILGLPPPQPSQGAHHAGAAPARDPPPAGGPGCPAAAGSGCAAGTGSWCRQ